jgi:hypothetical protein
MDFRSFLEIAPFPLMYSSQLCFFQCPRQQTNISVELKDGYILLWRLFDSDTVEAAAGHRRTGEKKWRQIFP